MTLLNGWYVDRLMLGVAVLVILCAVVVYRLAVTEEGRR